MTNNMDGVLHIVSTTLRCIRVKVAKAVSSDTRDAWFESQH